MLYRKWDYAAQEEIIDSSKNTRGNTASTPNIFLEKDGLKIKLSKKNLFVALKRSSSRIVILRFIS
ncbi:hypothetical protein A3E65_00310 [Candidatus Kaiserbacteria bacterium RIFCSPHIGHO2_12_FULL_56_13]|uniref:Uncharacterized protein n=1 Tax=Candidatus Kaiserbacteria bacterium RIFCSPHIGHO2_12_FULL_56_13 TaxID=1798505 RepID=A0A1F6EEX1_9BACT|nr:MAG: hypothetical protein A3E65_00310 [Candidatus Kaiserbacteria bacterium RIFCSPHIGHO2_12_FULL_56_13]